MFWNINMWIFLTSGKTSYTIGAFHLGVHEQGDGTWGDVQTGKRFEILAVSRATLTECLDV
jgi:hypothetical protein